MASLASPLLEIALASSASSEVPLDAMASRTVFARGVMPAKYLAPEAAENNGHNSIKSGAERVCISFRESRDSSLPDAARRVINFTNTAPRMAQRREDPRSRSISAFEYGKNDALLPLAGPDRKPSLAESITATKEAKVVSATTFLLLPFADLFFSLLSPVTPSLRILSEESSDIARASVFPTLPAPDDE